MAMTVITTVTLAASSYDLTDLATTKDELGIKTNDTSNDTFLKRAITQTSKAVANFCNRVFQVETLTDTIDIQRDAFPYQVPGGTPALSLSRWPIVKILSLTENDTALVEGTDFRIDYKFGLAYRLSLDSKFVVPWPALPIAVSYIGGYSVDTTKSANVPANPGPYTITVDNPSAFVLDRGVKYSSGAALIAVTTAPGVGQYMVSAGVYTFNLADAGVAVTIAYSYSEIPADVVAAALRVIAMRFKGKGRDPMLMRHSEPQIGEDSWWVGGGPRNSTFTPEIDALLLSYRVPVTG